MKERFLKYIAEYTLLAKKELSAVEPDMKIEAIPADLPKSMIDAKTQNNLFNAIYGCPNGVIRMSNEMTGLVEHPPILHC